MADGKKNRFSALSGKDKCDETEYQSLEKTVAEAVEEALNNENYQKPTVSAKQPTRGKKKAGPPSTTPTGQQIFYSQYDSRYVGCHWLIKPATLIGRNASLWLRSHHKCFAAYAVCAR